MSKEISDAVQYWVGPHLPREHIFVDPSKMPVDFLDKAKVYSKKWLVHPVRRHVAHLYSKYLEQAGTEIIGITGSAGKTTTKELVREVLSQKYKTVWSSGNIDPVYNIPQTLLRTPPATEKLVLEMGIEFPGEMDFYLWLAQPKTGIITTIYWTHTQFLKDIEGVIDQKGKLVKSLPEDGYAILNYDDPNVRQLADKTKARVIWYGITKKNDKIDVSGSDIQITSAFETRFTLSSDGRSVEVNLPLLGQHFVSLALAAAAVGKVNNISLERVKRGLEKVGPMEHRMRPIKKADGTVVIDDSFNANPLAVKEALRLMRLLGEKQRKILVLGEMKELGKFEVKGHEEVGAHAVNAGVEALFTLGGLTKHTIKEAVRSGMMGKNTFLAQNKNELVNRLLRFMKAGDLVLVKGSRSMGMEDVVEAIIR